MKPSIVIVSLGPGDPDLLNTKTIKAIQNAASLVLRTAQHPIAAWLERNNICYTSLDNLYDNAEDFDTLNKEIVMYLHRLSSCTDVVYAVPDASSDHTVRSVLAELSEKADITVIPGLSSYDMYLSSSLPFLSDYAVTSVSASDFLLTSYYNPNQTLLITELDNPILAGQVKILLSENLDDEHPVYLLSPDSLPVSIPLFTLDRQKSTDHRTAVLIPGSSFRSRNHFVMQDLVEIMDVLRSGNGCPWDRVQTHDSLRSYLIEEAWECVSSIDRNDMENLCDELGDLLFQIVFHASVGRSYDEFTLNDIITGICRKMIRRHPHVFGKDGVFSCPDSWEHLKQLETGHINAIDSLDDVSAGLPALKYASKIMKKLNLTDIGTRTPADIVSGIRKTLDKISNENKQDNHCIGIFLLMCVEFCMKLGVDSETVLHESADRLKEALKKAGQTGLTDGKTFKHLTFSELGVYLQYVEGEIE